MIKENAECPPLNQAISGVKSHYAIIG